MAWVFPDERCCPACGYTERTIVFQCRDGFRLSCSRCATISDALPALDAFFIAWGGDLCRYKVGAVIELHGVPHLNRGHLVENVPITVLMSKNTALVMENKNAA
ncbi:hypothetical protein DSS3P8_215 [Roseobacter phage DSS3P8]|nr:hypothetical protein DSS3P8_215 [Roseobacter phage DSS3P8]